MVKFSETDLIEAATCYLDGGADYREALKAVRLPPTRKTAYVILRFLIDWGELGRNLTKKDTDGEPRRKCLTALRKWLSKKNNRHDLKLLSQRTLLEFSTNPNKDTTEALLRLYKGLDGIPGFGATAVGKTLHILLPKLCVVWDEEYVRKKQGYGNNGHAYIEYLKTRGRLLCTLEGIRKAHKHRSLDETVHWIRERATEEYLARGRDAPITRFLDEINYGSERVVRRLKDLREQVRQRTQ